MSRTIIVVAGLALTLSSVLPEVHAQQRDKIPVIGFLGTAPERVQGVFVDAFRSGLRDAGYVDGRNIVLEVHFGNSNPSRIRALAAELVRRDVDVIVPVALTAVREAAKATKTIPIVAAFAANLVGSGLVASLAKPGGNVTGMSTFARARAAALIMIPGRVTGGHRRRLIALAIRWKNPTMCWRQGLAHLGCLMSYGANRSDLVRRSASHPRTGNRPGAGRLPRSRLG